VGEIPLAEVVERQLWKDPRALKANVLFAITALDNLPPMMRPSLTVVFVQPDPKHREVYPVGDEKYGLSKPVIMKMLNAVGASAGTRKISDRSDLDIIEWQATVWGRTPDGQFHQQTASKTWVWEKVKRERGGAAQRKFADEICETKAILRAARAFLNIQTSYTQPELAMPFLLASAVPDLDPSDPDVKKALIAQSTGAAKMLYPEQSSLPPMQPVIDSEIINADDDEEEQQPASPAAVAEGYDPLAEEAAPTPPDTGAAVEAELDTRIRELAGAIGQEKCHAILARHGIPVGGLKTASVDLKMLVVEDAQAVKEGRLVLP
jgi:hypothetical protein